MGFKANKVVWVIKGTRFVESNSRNGSINKTNCMRINETLNFQGLTLNGVRRLDDGDQWRNPQVHFSCLNQYETMIFKNSQSKNQKTLKLNFSKQNKKLKAVQLVVLQWTGRKSVWREVVASTVASLAQRPYKKEIPETLKHLKMTVPVVKCWQMWPRLLFFYLFASAHCKLDC